ncbi:diguanylate cyclase domain-containing protein [Solimicrobium silvestre]|uniref:GGDEF: diguanylate cyclase (GGDEF) domain n=1 Tax=Solimicrobium silvestre TaxID=2099400 RepID=A0A2S9GVL9_9BURK|nr:diguanylate cyclase [Solimicrobium silvestre]PRC91751.1 GGDEF: diguanylate cyclase (GGDEF) domain [Solimicrobium silvestre]
MHAKSTLSLWLNSTTRTSLFLQIATPLILIALAIVFQLNSLQASREQQLERTRLSAQDLGATLAASIAGSFQNINLTLLAATDHIRQQQSKGFDGRELNAELLELQSRVPSLILLSATNASGDVIFGIKGNRSEKVNVADREYFLQLMINPDAGMVISEPVMGRYSKKWVLICARRFNLPDGQFGGIVYGSIALDGMTERLSGKEMKLNENDAFVLRDNHMNVIVRYAHGKQDMQIMGSKINSPTLEALDKAGAQSGSYITNSVLDHVERSFYFQRISGQAMSLIVGLSIDDALSNWQLEVKKAWIVTGFFASIILLSFYLIYREQIRKLNVIGDLEATTDKLTEVLKFNEAILLNSPLPIGVYTVDGQCVKVNEALTQLVGASSEVLLSKNFRHITTWQTSGLLDGCLAALTNNSLQKCEVRMMTAFGKDIIAECRILPTQLHDATHLLIQFVDLTEIKRINSMLENILRSMKEGVHVVNEKGIILLENDASLVMLGWQDDNILGRMAHATIHHHHADRSDFPVEDCPIYATLQDGQVRHIDNDVFWKRDGSCFPVEYTVSPILNLQGGGHAATVVFRDITTRKRLEDELREQAFHDALTGLPNRRLLMDRIGQAIRVNKRHNSHAAVLFLDLNKFKVLNDTHGHNAGDQLLIEVAKRLTHVVRESDTVARLGGDEFVVLLMELNSQFEQAQEYAEFVADKIHNVLNTEYVFGEIMHQGSASIGIKLFFNEDDPDTILKAADAAMYEAKNRNNAVNSS